MSQRAGGIAQTDAEILATLPPRIWWVDAVAVLSRWLRAAGCYESGFALGQEVASITIRSRPLEELAALDAILLSLAGIINHPPALLNTKQRRELKDLRDKAIESVRERKRRLLKVAQNVETATRNVDGRLNDQASGETSKAISNSRIIKLNETQIDIIKHCKTHPFTGEAIARKVHRSEDHIRRVCGKLVKNGFLESTDKGYVSTDKGCNAVAR